MGFLDKLLGKKEKRPARPVILPTEEEKAQLVQLTELMRSKARECISFTVTERRPGLFDSKLGGPYYIPEGMDVAEVDGARLSLLAQINLETQPELPGFPTKGLLQFFIEDDADSGLVNVNGKNNHVEVRYIEEIPDTEDVRVVDEKTQYMPFDGGKCYALEAEKVRCIPSIESYEYEQILREAVPELMGKGNAFLSEYLNDNLYETLTTLPDVYISGNFMGGYPEFIQWDPREPGEYGTLLFQLGSDYPYVCWGDCGIGSFFIEREKLEKLDFSDVFYSWDCH